MEPHKPGNKKMPDFDKLNDRMIAQKPSSPTLVIKTNLDPQNVTENNPYFRSSEENDPKEFRDYFEE